MVNVGEMVITIRLRMTPEEAARRTIDHLPDLAGWQVQDIDDWDPNGLDGIAVREFPLQADRADYVLFVDKEAVGVIEAKPEGDDPGRGRQPVGEILGVVPRAVSPLSTAPSVRLREHGDEDALQGSAGSRSTVAAGVCVSHARDLAGVGRAGGDAQGPVDSIASGRAGLADVARPFNNLSGTPTPATSQRPSPVVSVGSTPDGGVPPIPSRCSRSSTPRPKGVVDRIPAGPGAVH